VLRIQLLWEQVELQETVDHNNLAQIQQYIQLPPVEEELEVVVELLII